LTNSSGHSTQAADAETEKQTDRQAEAEIQTDMQTDRQKQKYKQIGRQKKKEKKNRPALVADEATQTRNLKRGKGTFEKKTLKRCLKRWILIW
jgi:hypothetical protein